MIFAFCNQKGGVGKSTSIYHLTRAAVLEGLRVLVIDADPQGNITRALTDGLTGTEAVVADALTYGNDLTLADTLIPGVWEGLTVAPTMGDKLSPIRDELVAISRPGKEARLRSQLKAIKDDYDIVFIDCAPAMDTLTINALTAAEQVIVVTQSKQWSLDGLALLLEFVELAREHYNEGLSVGGLVVNLHEPHTASGQHWGSVIEEAAASNELRVFAPYIPKRQAITDAVEYGQGLDEGDAKARQLAMIYAEHLSQLLGRPSQLAGAPLSPETLKQLMEGAN